jgi:hypothetical protein
MEKLISIPEMVEMLNNPDILVSQPDALKEVNIFSRMRIPNTSIKVKNYICFNYNSRLNSMNSALKNVSIDIWVLCHDSEIDTLYGNRHDLIAGAITNALNWSNFLGCDLMLISDDEKIFDDGYNGRMLRFNNKTTNDYDNKVGLNVKR